MFWSTFIMVFGIMLIFAVVVALLIIGAGLVMGLIDSYNGENWILVIGVVIYLAYLSLILSGAVSLIELLFG